MPVYTYRCDNCGVQFDRTQKFSDQTLTRCPECGKKSLHKVYSPVGIVFKGSGFYSTDHRSPSGTSRHGSSHSEEKSSESGTPTESPAKTENTATESASTSSAPSEKKS